MHQAESSPQHCTNLGTWEVEAGRAQGYPQPHSEVEVSPSCKRKPWKVKAYLQSAWRPRERGAQNPSHGGGNSLFRGSTRRSGMGNTNGDQSGQHSSQGYIVGTGDRCVHSERPRSRKDSTAFLIQSPKVHILLTSSKVRPVAALSCSLVLSVFLSVLLL